MRVRMRWQRFVGIMTILMFVYLCLKGKKVPQAPDVRKNKALKFTIPKEELGTLQGYVSYLEKTIDWTKTVSGGFLNKSHEFFKDRPEPVCDVKFYDSFKENVESVQRYSFHGIDGYLRKLELDEIGIKNLLRNRTEHPGNEELVIVTGTSSNHFLEFQGLVKNLRETIFLQHNKVKFIFYNLGLTSTQLARTKKYCNCEIRQLHLKQYPPHVVYPNNYAWKPILLQAALKDFSTFVYLDTSFRFKKINSLDLYIKRAEKYGFQIPFDIRPIATMTDIRTLKFLAEEPCLFYPYPEAAAQIFIISRNAFSLQAIMKPFVACALQFGCMAHPNEVSLLSCRFEKTMNACHRFDQSVIGIILTRLFNVRRDLVTINLPDLGSVEREDKANVFPYR